MGVNRDLSKMPMVVCDGSGCYRGPAVVRSEKLRLVTFEGRCRLARLETKSIISGGTDAKRTHGGRM